jgi:hypothetical protein
VVGDRSDVAAAPTRESVLPTTATTDLYVSQSGRTRDRPWRRWIRTNALRVVLNRNAPELPIMIELTVGETVSVSIGKATSRITYPP